jgi:hypothetical protein
VKEEQMLSADPKRWYSWDYTLRGPEGPALAEIGLSSWRERGAVRLGGAEFTVRRDGWRGPFVLASAGSVRGQAVKTSCFRKSFEVEIDGAHYELTARSAWSRACVLRQGGDVIGTIAPAAWYSRRARVEVPRTLPPLLTAFAVWLTLLLWKRDDDAAVAGA